MDHPRFLALVADPPARWRPFAAAAVAALAIGAAIAAATLHVLSSYSLIVAGVLAATWYAGLRFGLATLALAMALAWLFVAEPLANLESSPRSSFY